MKSPCLKTTLNFFWSTLLCFSSIQSLSCVQLFATPWTAARQASLSITTPGVYSNSCPLSRWCHPTISSPVVPFSSRLQSFPASGSFPMSSSSHQVGKVLNWISQIILNPEEVWNFFEYNYYNYSLKGYLKNVYVYQCLFGKLTIAQYRFFERMTMKSWATDFQRSIVHLEKINSL